MSLLELRSTATTVTAKDGRFYPAYTNGPIGQPIVFAGIKFDNELDAYDYAARALGMALVAAEATMRNHFLQDLSEVQE